RTICRAPALSLTASRMHANRLTSTMRSRLHTRSRNWIWVKRLLYVAKLVWQLRRWKELTRRFAVRGSLRGREPRRRRLVMMHLIPETRWQPPRPNVRRKADSFAAFLICCAGNGLTLRRDG